LVELSRQQGVTIFISTHFMNEAERCDRISLMHAGRVLASDTPDALRLSKQAPTLEAAFITYLEEASAADTPAVTEPEKPAVVQTHLTQPHHAFSLRRLLAYAYREALELKRDTIRIAFALLGSVLMMAVLGYGISLDVENLRFAVLDQDQSPESRAYVHNIAGSRYFQQQPTIRSSQEMEQRMRSGELSVALEIPAGFGHKLRLNRQPEIAAWIDGALPYRGEMALGYVQGIHQQYLVDLITETTGTAPQLLPTDMALRYRYNQDFRSIYAMVPAVIPLLLMFIPAILMALGVVREKELGSITNLYVTPVTRLEFLLGKQLPYIVVAMTSYACLVVQAVWMFDVPIKGSLLTLTLGTLLYVMTTTGLGLVISTFTRTQIAALFGSALLTMLPTVQFSGLTTPVGSLSGMAYGIGQCFPATYYLIISRGVFTKALGLSDLIGPLLTLAAFIPVLTLISLALLPKQER
jgi:ribosome-dependent ATPase